MQKKFQYNCKVQSGFEKNQGNKFEQNPRDKEYY